MKKSFSWLLMLLLSASLSACATTKGTSDKHMVKCPECGYQFEYDSTKSP